MNHGHATVLFSELVKNVWHTVSSLIVGEEAVLFQSYHDIALLSPEMGKIVIVTLATEGTSDVNFDVVRGTLVCLVADTDGTCRLFVAKLSRIFEHTERTEPIPLKDICEICRVLTFIQPNPGDSRYIMTVCDPMRWGSARPCRILITQIDFRSSNNQGNKTVRVHRLYLEGSHNGSDLALTHDSSSNCVFLEKSSDCPLQLTRPSIPGRWILPGGGGHGKYDIMVCRLWEDDVRLFPSDRFPSAIWEEVERFSGTKICHLLDGNCLLQFFD